MSDPVSTASCPHGHTSIDRIFCSVCGTPIGARFRPEADAEATTATPIVAAPGFPGSPELPEMPEPPEAPEAPEAPSPWDQMGASGPTGPGGPARRPGPPLDLDPSPEAAAVPPEPPDLRDTSQPTGPTGSTGSTGSTGPTGPTEPARLGRLPRRLAAPRVSAGASGIGSGSAPPPVARPGNPGEGDPGPRPVPPGLSLCPHCSAQLDEGSRFCEVCGYDPTTGSLPEAPVVRPAAAPPPAPEPPPVARPMVAVITADRAYYDSHQVNDVQFPLGAPPRTIELAPAPVSIGRRSRSRGTNPELDLAGPPEDPAVSHTHASLLPKDDGTWELVDHGSTNGTYLNESPEPLAANRPVPVAAGDRIYLGAWTRITLEHRRP